MKKALAVALAAALMTLLSWDTSEACCRKKKPPPPPKCPADSEGSMNSVGGGSASVTFSPKGAGMLFASPTGGMQNGASQGCACAIAVKKGLGISASGVTFPSGYPSFSPSNDADHNEDARAFMDRYLRAVGKNPADFDVHLFSTPPGQSVPDSVSFNLTVGFNIPQGSDGSELSQDNTILGMMFYDGRELLVEPNTDGGAPIDLATYTSSGFNLTSAALFKSKVAAPGSGLRATPVAARQIANGVCINGGFDCDLNRNGLVDTQDLMILVGDQAVTDAVSATCAEPTEPMPTEPKTIELFVSGNR